MAGELLKVTAGNASGQDIELEQELVIGRSTPGAGSLGGDSEISRVHARVYRDASGQLTVEDLGSTNGTFVNGTRISSPTPLRPGDELRVGQTTLSVEGGAGAEGATAVGTPIPPAVAAPPPAAAAAVPPTQPLPPAAPPPPGAQYGGQQQPGYAGGPVDGAPGSRGGGSKAPWIALAAVVLIALIVAGLAIGGVFSSDDNKKTNASTQIAPVSTSTTPATTPPPATSAMPAPPQEPSTPSSSGYPPGFLSKLIQGCDKSGKLSHSQCVCWFTKLKNAYTFPELVTVLKKARGGSIPPKAVSLLRTCLNQ
jgi:predicted component of type VI protein secretion system